MPVGGTPRSQKVIDETMNVRGSGTGGAHAASISAITPAATSPRPGIPRGCPSSVLPGPSRKKSTHPRNGRRDRLKSPTERRAKGGPDIPNSSKRQRDTTMSSKYTLATILVAYTGNPRIAANVAISLARGLRQKAPTDARPEQLAKLQAVERSAEEVDVVINARDRTGAAAEGAARTDVTGALTAMESSLNATASLPDAVSPAAAPAREVSATLFAGAPPLSAMSAKATWAHGKRVLQRIDEEGLEPKIVAAGAAAFLSNLRRAVDGLAIAAGLSGTAVDEPGKTALAQANETFRSAVGAYARALSADIDESDPATLQRFLNAVAPIDELRSKSDGDSDDEVETPAAPVVSTPAPVLADPVLGTEEPFRS